MLLIVVFVGSVIVSAPFPATALLDDDDFDDEDFDFLSLPLSLNIIISVAATSPVITIIETEIAITIGRLLRLFCCSLLVIY